MDFGQSGQTSSKRNAVTNFGEAKIQRTLCVRKNNLCENKVFTHLHFHFH